MDKIRIGMVTLCYRPTVNGVVRMIDLYKEQFEALGHEVKIFTLGLGNHHHPRVVKSLGVPIGKTGYYVNPYLNQKAANQMAQMDILHCHHLFLNMGWARRYGRCPIVYTNHTRYDLYAQTLIPLPKKLLQSLMEWYWPRACQQADAVIAPSATVHQILKTMGVPEPLVIIENGIAQRPFVAPDCLCANIKIDVPEDATLLMYVGRLSKEKNLDKLLHQFKKVQAQFSTAYLMIVGDGPDRARLQKMCQVEKIESHVIFQGQVSPMCVPHYLTVADLFVTASRSEVHPLTLLEAMAAGVPIVAPLAPGNQDLIDHGRTGLLMQDDGFLSEGMLELIHHPEKRRDMGMAARQQSSQLTIEKTVQKTLALYQQLLRERPDRSRNKRNGRFSSRFWDKMLPKRS